MPDHVQSFQNEIHKVINIPTKHSGYKILNKIRWFKALVRNAGISHRHHPNLQHLVKNTINVSAGAVLVNQAGLYCFERV